MENKFVPHQIVWTNDKSSRIWNHFAHDSAYEDRFFSKKVGNAIIDCLLPFSNLSGNILDYGCGHGYLIEKLLRRGIACEGLDFSQDSVELVEKKFHKETLFKGVTLATTVPTQLEGDKFDAVFFVETIEHILDQNLKKTLTEIHRITRKGGFVLVTTPNAEDLEASKVLCPECGCIFHRMQHVSSWTKDSLSAIMKDNGFSEVMCKATRLKKKGKSASLFNIMLIIAFKVMKKRNPHLIYIGRKEHSNPETNGAKGHGAPMQQWSL